MRAVGRRRRLPNHFPSLRGEDPDVVEERGRELQLGGVEIHRSGGAFEVVRRETDRLRAQLKQTEAELKQLKDQAGSKKGGSRAEAGDARTPDKTIGQVKYADGQKKNEGGAGKPQRSPLEPEKQGGIGGP